MILCFSGKEQHKRPFGSHGNERLLPWEKEHLSNVRRKEREVPAKKLILKLVDAVGAARASNDFVVIHVEKKKVQV